MAADRRPMPCPADRCPVPPSNMPKRKKTTPQLHGSVPCRAGPDRKRRHACSCCPSVPCYAADRPTEFCVPYPYQKKTKTNKQKKGMGKGKKPLRCCAFPSPSRPTEAKKKRELSKMPNGLSHDHALPIGNPTLLGLLGLLGFFGLLLRPESPLAPAPTLALGL